MFYIEILIIYNMQHISLYINIIHVIIVNMIYIYLERI